MLALLGVLLGARRLGWHRLTDVGGAAVDALSRAGQLALRLLDLGWPLLLVAVSLALALTLSSSAVGAAGRWLWSRPARWLVRLLIAVSVLAGLLVVVVVVLPPRFTASHSFDNAA